MRRLLSSIYICLVLETLYNSSVTGYKWIHIEPNNPIPKNAKVLSPGLGTYVGRARHYNEILPAEVYNSSCALIYSCSQIIMKSKFEILVDAEDCIELELNYLTNVTENILHIGNSWSGEPTYIGIANAHPYNHIGQILLTSKEILNWEGTSGLTSTLICKSPNEWIDTSSEIIPNNTVFGGKSADGNDIYVARLKSGCDIIPGQCTPALSIATAVYEGNNISSSYCQVLTEGSSTYSWVWAQKGEIPDYAVVGAKDKNNELMYIGRVNTTLGYITYSKALNYLTPYEILVHDDE